MDILRNHSLKKYNTFGVEANTRYFCQIKNDEDIDIFVEQINLHRYPCLLLGGGSNVLFTDDFSGLTAIIETKGIELLSEDSDYFYIRANAGENWHQLVRWTIDKGYAGLENLSLIPGTVGAAPVQNIGAYGVELADRLHELEAIDLSSGESKVFNNKECRFSYRNSYFKSIGFDNYLIKNITLKLSKKPEWRTDYAGIAAALDGKAINARMISDAIIAIRQSKLPDPAIIGNAGSFFKNPILNLDNWQKLKECHPNLPGYQQTNGQMKTSSAWLIDQCDWKGKRKGDAGTYEKHALVLVNHGKATGAELWGYAQDIVKSVEDKFGIHLEAEPRIITS